MRGLVPDLGAGPRTGSPIAARLPRIFTDDDYAMRLVDALDIVLAAPLSAFDNFFAYLDPDTAPADFVRWLAHWVSASGPDDLADDRLRARAKASAHLAARRGTRDALVEELSGLTGHLVDVVDPGSVQVSSAPGGEFPAPAAQHVEVVVHGPCDRAAVNRVLQQVAPAHLDVTLRIEDPDPPPDPTPADPATAEPANPMPQRAGHQEEP